MVLISYSHDTTAHQTAVLALADRLRGEGVEVVLDQYESFPAQGWIQWMKAHILTAEFILMICTEAYCRRANGAEAPGVGLGARYESQLIQQLLYNTGGVNERFIPVVLAEKDRDHIPIELQRYPYFRVDTAAGYEDLYRLLTHQPKTTKPDLGPVRPLPKLQAKGDFHNFFWNVPPRNECFTGREAYLRDLHQTLAQTRAAAITGIGGMGKTQTAIEYAHLHRGDYEAVLWAGASQDAFAALASVLDLREKDEKELRVVVTAVTRWLQSNSGWLLIFDNVDTLEALNEVRGLAPSDAPGHLLVTTKLQATGRVAKAVPLEKMEPAEGGAFLLGRAPGSDRTLAEQVSQELGGLPLALDQAAAFLEEMPSTLGEYQRLYQKEGARLRKRRGEVRTEHLSVAATFSLAFAQLKRKDRAAADLVRACAFLAPDDIPEEILIYVGPLFSELKLLEAIQEAGRFALLRRNPVSKTVDMHRQVQEVLKDEMYRWTRRRWAERTVDALAYVFPPAPEFRNWPKCERFLAHAKAAVRWIGAFGLDSEAAVFVLSRTGYYLADRAEYAEAGELFERVVSICEKRLGVNHPSVATNLSSLGLIYVNQGRFEDAEPLYQRALAIRERCRTPENVETAHALNNLAGLYQRQRRYHEAEPLYRRSLAICEKSLGPDDPRIALALNNLGKVCNDQKRYEEAEHLYQRGLAICEKVLGPDHPGTATCLNNIALLYADLGQFDRAAPLLRRALGIFESALGSDHPNTVNTQANYSAVLSGLGASGAS